LNLLPEPSYTTSTRIGCSNCIRKRKRRERERKGEKRGKKGGVGSLSNNGSHKGLFFVRFWAEGKKKKKRGGKEKKERRGGGDKGGRKKKNVG